MLGDPLNINHIILLPKNINDRGTSFFQGFSRILIENYSWIYPNLILFPQHYYEITSTLHECVVHRVFSPSLSIHFIRENVNIDLLLNQYYFHIIWTSEQTYESGVRISKMCNLKPMHISVNQTEEALSYRDLTSEIIRNHLLGMAEELAANPPSQDVRKALGLDSNTIIRKKEKKFTSYEHNVFIPSLMALYWYGYKIKTRQFPPTIDQSVYTNILNRIINEIDKVRKSHIEKYQEALNDIVVYCPSIYTLLYDYRSAFWRTFIKELKLDKFHRKFIKDSIVKIRSYSAFSMDVGKNGLSINNNRIDLKENDDQKSAIEIYNPYDDPKVRLFLVERQKELELFTSIISILTSSQLIGGIRFPNSVMHGLHILKDIGKMFLAKSRPSTVKLNRKFREYSEYIKEAVGLDLLKLSFNKHKNVLAICDFPIEWVSLNETPLMFTHEISRISPTPGNLFQFQLLSNDMININYRELFSILVISSFSHHDPIRDTLKNTLDSIDIKDFKKINFVRVNTKEQLIDALNSFNGYITIFDCHGGHGGANSSGWITIGNENIDIWDLYDDCKFSPIIILSACSTHAIDGSHASVANGFINGGALAILGSYVPIEAQHTSNFVGNLVKYIYNYLPYILASGGSITWRKFISNLLKVSYVSDIIRDMKLKNEISIKLLDRVFLSVQDRINHGDPKWHSVLITKLSHILELNISHTKALLSHDYQYTPTMLYVQLGSPEKIRLHNEDKSPA